MRHLRWSLAILGCDTQHSPSRTLASSWTCTLFHLLLNTGPHTHTHTQKRTKTSCQHTGLLARPAQLFSRKCHILLIQKTSNRFFSIKFQLTVTFTYSTRSVWCGRDKEKKYFQLCCRRRQVEMSERELAVCASTDSSEMNVEGGGEELHTYKMYLYAFSVCL